jgi:hypothetical protein
MSKEDAENNGGELADTNCCRRRENRKSSELRAESIEQSSRNGGSSYEGEIGEGRFPSRPNEQQQPWEAPRTIGNEEIISAMGGSTYGVANGSMVHSCRVDSLRLLGNGVVPIVAAKAFVVLMARINNGEQSI